MPRTRLTACRGFVMPGGGSALRITRWDGLITVKEAAELCGVEEVTVRNWSNRGYGPKGSRRKLPVAKRENGLNLLDPVEVAKADHATKGPARRVVIRPAFPAAA